MTVTKSRKSAASKSEKPVKDKPEVIHEPVTVPESAKVETDKAAADDLTADERQELEELAAKIKEADAKAEEIQFEIAKYLSRAKEIFGRYNGGKGFRPWLKENTKFSPSSAYNYIAVYDTFVKRDEYRTVLHWFDWTAMLKLAQREGRGEEGNPFREKARAKALDRIRNKERIDNKAAKELLADAGFVPTESPSKTSKGKVTIQHDKFELTLESRYLNGMKPEAIEAFRAEVERQFVKLFIDSVFSRLDDETPLPGERRKTA